MAEVLFATAFARSVLPVPGSPYRMTPFGGLMPMSSYLGRGASQLRRRQRLRAGEAHAQLGVGQRQLHRLLDLLDLLLQPANVRVRLQRRFLHLQGTGGEFLGAAATQCSGPWLVPS